MLTSLRYRISRRVRLHDGTGTSLWEQLYVFSGEEALERAVCVLDGQKVADEKEGLGDNLRLELETTVVLSGPEE